MKTLSRERLRAFALKTAGSDRAVVLNLLSGRTLLRSTAEKRGLRLIAGGVEGHPVTLAGDRKSLADALHFLDGDPSREILGSGVDSDPRIPVRVFSLSTSFVRFEGELSILDKVSISVSARNPSSAANKIFSEILKLVKPETKVSATFPIEEVGKPGKRWYSGSQEPLPVPYILRLGQKVRTVRMVRKVCAVPAVPIEVHPIIARKVIPPRIIRT